MAKKLTTIGLAIFLVATLTMGCAVLKSLRSEMAPVDKAVKIGAELMDQYTLIHKNAEEVYATADEETKAFLEDEIFEDLNTTKALIKNYNSVVHQWKKGELSIDPSDSLYELQQRINDSLTSALLLINQLAD